MPLKQKIDLDDLKTRFNRFLAATTPGMAIKHLGRDYVYAPLEQVTRAGLTGKWPDKAREIAKEIEEAEAGGKALKP